MKMMFRTTTPAGGEMSDERTRSISSRSSTASMSSSSSSGMSSDHHLQLQAAAAALHDAAGSSNSNKEEEKEEEVVGVAVGKEVKECKANLLWALSNIDAIIGNGERKKKATVMLLHVHRPAKTIPFMGANFPADQLHESEVAAFRQAETEAMNRAMTKYRVICARVKVPAVCKVAADAGDDVAQGILSLVAQNGITRLVVGAAADKRYSRKLTAPTSKTALSVRQQVPPDCSIWFVCKGNLVCTRLATIRGASRNRDEERKATGGGHLVPLGSYIESLHYDEPSSSSVISGQEQQQQLLPVPVAAAGGGSDNEMMQKQDIQTTFAEAEKLRREKHAMTTMMSQQAAAAVDHHEELAVQLLSSKRVISDLQAKLSEAHCMLFSLERDQDELRRQRDAAVTEAAALRDMVRHLEDQLLLARGFTELSYQDLQQATNNLDETLKLGHRGGGYGSVYKAALRRHDRDQEAVAIKVLNPHGISSHSFQQRVEELRRLRHPNLVPLLGACSDPEALALVYELVPGAGSLEDRLLLDDTLPWPDRTRTVAQICSALVFLHQNNMVHGDLKPANVLLDVTTKLADYGLCRLLEPHDAGAVLLRCNATTSLAYMDPEFLASGELRPSSDVYAFGVLLLRLLTGRPAMGLVKHVQAVLAAGTVPEIMDKTAGEWPYPQEQALQLAQLGVKCCDIASANRPELAGEVVTQTLGCYLNCSPLGW